MEENNNFKIMRLIRITENVIKRDRAKTGPATHGNGHILAALQENNGITQIELAEKLEIRPQSLTRALAELEEQGRIVRNRDEKDRRIIRVYITQAGTQLYDCIQQHRQQRADRIFSCLSEKEQDQLIAILTKTIAYNREREEKDV